MAELQYLKIWLRTSGGPFHGPRVLTSKLRSCFGSDLVEDDGWRWGLDLIVHEQQWWLLAGLDVTSGNSCKACHPCFNVESFLATLHCDGGCLERLITADSQRLHCWQVLACLGNTKVYEICLCRIERTCSCFGFDMSTIREDSNKIIHASHRLQ